MLVLTRRPNQSIIIGNDVVVTVLDVKGDQVRLGIRAPKAITVHREEVYAELARENRAAASPSPEAIGKLAALRPPARPADAGTASTTPAEPVG